MGAHAESASPEAPAQLCDGARLFIVVIYRNDEAANLPEQYPGSSSLMLERLKIRDSRTRVIDSGPAHLPPEFITACIAIQKAVFSS